MFLFDMWMEEGKGMIFFFNFVFSLWSGYGQGVKGFFLNLLKGDGREFFFYVEKG